MKRIQPTRRSATRKIGRILFIVGTSLIDLCGPSIYFHRILFCDDITLNYTEANLCGTHRCGGGASFLGQLQIRDEVVSRADVWDIHLLSSFVWFLPRFYRKKEKLTNVQRKAFICSNTSREHSREVSDETDYSISKRLPSGRRCSSLGRVRRRTPSTYLALILSASTPEMSKLLV